MPDEQQPAAPPPPPAPAPAPAPPRPKRKRVIKRKTKGLWKKGDNQVGPNPRLPNSYNEKVAKEILLTIRAGSTYETASSTAGVSRKTLHNWLRKGLRSKKLPDGHPEKVPELEKFRADFKKAQRWAIRNWELRLARIGVDGDADVLKWLLERRDPGNYGRRDRIEHSGPEGEPLEFGPRIILNLPPNGRDITAEAAAAKANAPLIDVIAAPALPPTEPKEP